MASGNAGHDSGAHRTAAFAHGEAHAGFDGDRTTELEPRARSLAGSKLVLVERQPPRHIRCSEKELRRVPRTTGRPTPALVAAQKHDLGRTSLVSRHRAGSDHDLAAHDFIAIDAAQEQADA